MIDIVLIDCQFEFIFYFIVCLLTTYRDTMTLLELLYNNCIWLKFMGIDLNKNSNNLSCSYAPLNIKIPTNNFKRPIPDLFYRANS